MTREDWKIQLYIPSEQPEDWQTFAGIWHDELKVEVDNIICMLNAVLKYNYRKSSKY